MTKPFLGVAPAPAPGRETVKSYSQVVKLQKLWIVGLKMVDCWVFSPRSSNTYGLGMRLSNQLSNIWLAKVFHHGLDFLKPEIRPKRRSRSLVFLQITLIILCWKVITELLPSHAKNKLSHISTLFHLVRDRLVLSKALFFVIIHLFIWFEQHPQSLSFVVHLFCLVPFANK